MLADVAIEREGLPRLGTRKLHDALARRGVRVGRDHLFTLLRAAGQLVARKRRGTQTTYSQHRYAVAPNLLATMTITAPRQAVVSDITYLALAGGTFAYLFLVTDLASRHIVGWHLSRDLAHHAALQALGMAQQTLGDCTGIVHHSDRGTQPEFNRSLQQSHCVQIVSDRSALRQGCASPASCEGESSARVRRRPDPRHCAH